MSGNTKESKALEKMNELIKTMNGVVKQNSERDSKLLIFVAVFGTMFGALIGIFNAAATKLINSLSQEHVVLLLIGTTFLIVLIAFVFIYMASPKKEK